MKWRAVWRNRNVGDILMLPLLPEDVEIAFQVTNYCKIFEIGSPLPILGKITTSPAIRAISEGTATWFVQGDTFSEWKSSGPSSLLWIHGKSQSLPCATPSPMLTVFLCLSRSREKCSL